MKLMNTLLGSQISSIRSKEEPAKHRQKYAPAWDAAINRFTREFVENLCFSSGNIDWEQLVQFVNERK